MSFLQPQVKGSIPVGALVGGAAQVVSLPVGADGTVLTADSTTPSGLKYAAGGGGGVTMAEATLLKPFFSANGLLPSNTIREDLYTYPANDFSFLGGGSSVRSMSMDRFTPGGSPGAVWGWDMGVLYDKMLFILTMSRPRNFGLGIFFCDTIPITNEIPDNGYLLNAEINNTRFVIYKKTGGSFTALGTESAVSPTDSVSQPDFGMAFYYDNLTNRLVAFLRIGAETWWPIIDLTDSSFTTMRYVGIRVSGGDTGKIMWTGVPLAVYAE